MGCGLFSKKMYSCLINCLVEKFRKRNKHVFLLPGLTLPSIQKFSYKDLEKATNGFNPALLIGRGRFGNVYKGTTNTGQHIVVKVLDLENTDVENSFTAECNAKKQVRHRNIVTVITVTSYGADFRALVYPYMPYGSLEELLYGPKRRKNGKQNRCSLGLKTRLEIALDIAHAIEYLHHDCHIPIVHCNIKPGSILLSDDFTAKLTDFSAARFDSNKELPLFSAMNVAASAGYIAPEYVVGEKASTRGDVYSYGVTLLEMLTRRKPTDEMFLGRLNMQSWVNMALPNQLEEIIDEDLWSEIMIRGNEKKTRNSWRCIASLVQLGLLCSAQAPQQRPSMMEATKALHRIREGHKRMALAKRSW